MALGDERLETTEASQQEAKSLDEKNTQSGEQKVLTSPTMKDRCHQHMIERNCSTFPLLLHSQTPRSSDILIKLGGRSESPFSLFPLDARRPLFFVFRKRSLSIL